MRRPSGRPVDIQTAGASESHPGPNRKRIYDGHSTDNRLADSLIDFILLCLGSGPLARPCAETSGGGGSAVETATPVGARKSKTKLRFPSFNPRQRKMSKDRGSSTLFGLERESRRRLRDC